MNKHSVHHYRKSTGQNIVRKKRSAVLSTILQFLIFLSIKNLSLAVAETIVDAT